MGHALATAVEMVGATTAPACASLSSVAQIVIFMLRIGTSQSNVHSTACTAVLKVLTHLQHGWYWSIPPVLRGLHKEMSASVCWSHPRRGRFRHCELASWRCCGSDSRRAFR